MEKVKLSNSTRKFIRKEKAKFRLDVSDPKEREKLISELYQRFLKIHVNKPNLQPSNK